MSQLSASAVQPLSTPKRAVRPAPVLVPAAKPAPEEPRELDIIGPRKLIRPTLPERALRNRRYSRRDEPALSWQSATAGVATAQDSSHAESFYFQKQMQARTPMVFVLEDGERIEGCIEWYDRYAIKVHCSLPAAPRLRGPRPGESATRALIYKSSIKYLHKAGENL
ncbi:MAG TPA: hypothetical protein VME18_10510 [Acidobacteriaceae bacterium]|nr:hypothetical protein [Acidobacteriaceae bacterium]